MKEITTAVGAVSAERQGSRWKLACHPHPRLIMRAIAHNEQWTDEHGCELLGVGAGRRCLLAGLYVPGGLASYPSSVLMNAIPQGPQASGAGNGLSHARWYPETRLCVMAAQISGVDEVFYRDCGAACVSALAYGHRHHRTRR